MKVKELMTSGAGFCYGVDSLTKAAIIMWQFDCGSVPVVDAENKVIGVVTDRDICIATASRDMKPSEIHAGELCNGHVLTVSPDDDIKDAIKSMRKNRVRRLVVVDRDGYLRGMVTMADIINAAAAKKKSKSLRKRAFLLMAAITRKTPIKLAEIEPEETEETEPVSPAPADAPVEAPDEVKASEAAETQDTPKAPDAEIEKGD